jgi:hypothetical protein
LVSLGFHEVSSPTDCRHEVVGTYDFWFHRASSIELLLGQTPIGNPVPKDRPPPLCPRMLGWTVNAASTHHFKMPVPLALRISGSVRMPLRYFIRWVSLFQLSLLGARTLIVKNAIAVQVLGLARLVAYNVLATRLWNSTAISGGSFSRSLTGFYQEWPLDKPDPKQKKLCSPGIEPRSLNYW